MSVPNRTVVTGDGFPRVTSYPRYTDEGVPYFREAGVAMVAATKFDPRGARSFFDGWHPSLRFGEYLLDEPTDDDGGMVAKYAGQTCYLSFGPTRTWNKDADRYLGNIKDERHGSICEHAAYTFHIWGVDRSVTHELVRHRVGFGFSQVSQRYCGGKTLRFAERPEWQVDRLPESASHELRRAVAACHRDFEVGVNFVMRGYDVTLDATASLSGLGHPMFAADGKTASRKAVRQAVRGGLPNCVEAPIVVSGNGRAWRNLIDRRATPRADVQIREMTVKLLRCLQVQSPLIFGDYAIGTGGDGIDFATSKHFGV